MTKKGTDTIAYKESVLNGLVTTIGLYDRPMLPKEKAKHDDIKDTMEGMCRALWEEARGRELDIKIDAFKELVKMLKREI